VRIAATLVTILLAALRLQVPTPSRGYGPAAPLPDRDQFMTRVRAAIRIDTDVQQDFTYLERRRDVKISGFGKVSVGPLRTFEVFPSPDPAHTYKRLIEVDGKPLDRAELARRDAEHARDLDEQERRERRESPEQRARRLESVQADRRDRMAILNDALAVYEATILGRDAIEGEPAIVVRLTPKPEARVSTREGNWMKQFSGRAWFVERDAQFAGFDMQAGDDVSIGWGIVGRLHKGSRLVVQRRPVGGVWLPSRLTFEASGKTLMFRPFTLNVTTEYFGYKRR
jgi:hypothetical protein